MIFFVVIVGGRSFSLQILVVLFVKAVREGTSNSNTLAAEGAALLDFEEV